MQCISPFLAVRRTRAFHALLFRVRFASLFLVLVLLIGTPPGKAAVGFDCRDGLARLVRVQSPYPDPVTLSALFAYDLLDRLVAWDLGRLAGDPLQIDDPFSNQPARCESWALDILGNLRGDGGTQPGHEVLADFDGDGQTETLKTWHDTDARNRVESVTTHFGGAPTATAFVYDRAGNLVCDGVYVFQYDAWNRLVQVNLAGTLTFDEDGRVDEGAPGAWLFHLAYDGLGRVIRKQSPWPPPDVSSSPVRTEHYYYDGIRRIQEVIGEPQPEVIPEEPETLSLGEESGLQGGVGNPEASPELPPEERSYWRHREFIWGPDYIDELILQQEVRPEGLAGPAHGPAMYAITNLGYDVVALIDADGIVLRQYVYDPYGRVVEAHSLADHAPSRVGHKGLFFSRLDAPAQGPQLVGGAVGLYHCRNREARPDLQRWMQQDPNGTGMVVLDAAAMHGATLWPGAVPPSAAVFTDGLNLHAYLGSSPVLRADVLGLEWSYANLLATMSLQGTIQGTISGTLAAMNGQSFGGGFAIGFVAGALGGAGGYAANAAFAASASGLWATLGAHSLVGAADGALSAGVQSYLTYHDARMALADAMWGAAVGAATAGTLSGAMRWARGADDLVLEGAGAFVSRGATGRASPQSLREMLALAQARANPQAGRRLDIEMSDPRWPAAEGWGKYAERINGVEIHYVYNPRLGIADDFKFK